MTVNEHKVERAIRVVLGLAILSGFFWFTAQFGISKWWSLVGLVPLLTGLSGVCPLYSIVGVSTCTKAES